MTENQTTGSANPQRGTPSSSWTLYKRILAYLLPYKKHIALVLLFNFLFIIFNTLAYWMIAPVVNTLFSSGEQAQVVQEAPVAETSFWNLNEWLKQNVQSLLPQGDQLEMLKFLCLFIFITFLLKNIFAYIEFFWASFVEQKVIKDLREELYSHILSLPMTFFHKRDTGGLMSNVTNDINTINTAVNRSFTKIIRDPILIIIFMALLVSISWQLTLASLLIFPITFGMIQVIGKSLRRKSHRVQERISEITSLLHETISGIKVVKAFANEAYEDSKFRDRTSEHFRAVLRQIRLNRLSSPLSETVGVGMMVAVLWIGGHLVLQGQLLTSEDFIRFITILFAVTEPIKSLGDMSNNIQIALASGTRVFDILDIDSDIVEKADPLEKGSFDSSITYENVRFRYSETGEQVLDGIDLEIKKNEKVAFVGSSGAGKTTIINLLPRFYDVTGGAIRIDGVDIRDLSLNSLRRLIGLVTQEVVLFNDTVANNIAYGSGEHTQADIEAAAKLANAHGFVSGLSAGYDTVIGESGVLLSGGQRQRISIARAILRNPPILIFDEATSSLDSESEHLIQAAIERAMEDRTVLMIAHRLSSILNSDKLVVLENGKIIDIGKHDELLKRSERYRYLYELQFVV